MDMDLDRDDWHTLRLAPFWVFSALAGKYSEFRPIETGAFWQCLDVAASEAEGLARQVLTSVTADREWLGRDYALDGRSVASGLCRVSSILSTLPPDEATHFRTVLYTSVATRLARARGPFGDAVTSEDADTVTLIAVFLDVDTDSVNPLDLPLPV